MARTKLISFSLEIIRFINSIHPSLEARGLFNLAYQYSNVSTGLVYNLIWRNMTGRYYESF
jgi:hypothetical protein